jgi:hypothetical protein
MATPEDELWTVKDVAAFLQVPERKIWNMQRGNSYARIPSVELDGKPRFVRSQVMLWQKRFGHKLRKMTSQEAYRRWVQLNASSSAVSTPRNAV